MVDRGRLPFTIGLQFTFAAIGRPPKQTPGLPVELAQPGRTGRQPHRTIVAAADPVAARLQPEQADQTKPAVRPGQFRVTGLPPILQSNFHLLTILLLPFSRLGRYPSYGPHQRESKS